jgi:hypothetical protein
MLASLAAAAPISQADAPPAAAPSAPVVQTGFQNYAGPSCPGIGWTCTTATNVVQTTVKGGTNVFECKGGTGSDDTCTIVQSADHGLNQARCVEDDAAGAQQCTVTQANLRGVNQALLRQVSRMDGGADATQSTHQVSALSQCNVIGSNTGRVHQEIIHVASDASSPSVSQSQDATMEYAIDQVGPPDGQATCPATPPPAPPTADCGSIHSSDTAVVRQRVRQDGEARSAVTGSQSQSSTILGSVGQCTAGRATWKVGQSQSQKLRAASSSVVQTQTGPIRCCDAAPLPVPNQGTSAQDRCTLRQDSTQVVQPTPAASRQVEDMHAHAETTGLCDANLTLSRDGETQTEHFSGGPGNPLDGGIGCGATCPPQLTYTGDVRKRIGRRAVLQGKLVQPDGTPIPGAVVAFSIVGGPETCSALTGPDGVAVCKVRIVGPPGLYLVQALFHSPSLPADVTTTRRFHVRCPLDDPSCT